MSDRRRPRCARKGFLQRGDSLLIHALLFVGSAHHQRGQSILAIVERAARGLDRLVVGARPEVMPAAASQQVRVERIQLLGDVTFFGRFLAPVCPQQEMRESVPHARVAWVELSG